MTAIFSNNTFNDTAKKRATTNGCSSDNKVVATHEQQLC